MNRKTPFNTNIFIHQYKSITYMHASTKDMNKWMCKHWITYSTADQRIEAISGRHTGITPFPSHTWRAHAFPCSGVTHSIRTITGWNQQNTHVLQWLTENFNGVDSNWLAITQSWSLKSNITYVYSEGIHNILLCIVYISDQSHCLDTGTARQSWSTRSWESHQCHTHKPGLHCWSLLSVYTHPSDRTLCHFCEINK